MVKFKKGQRRPSGSGRRPGSKNKVNVAIRQAIHEALNAAPGAVVYLTRLRDSKTASDRAAFLHLVGRTLPRDVEMSFEVSEEPQVVVYIPDNQRGPMNSESAKQYKGRISRRGDK